ncbi:MAG: tetratricopeptide repeat protein [Gammaproteobacteria bacterium]|nr:tetratricopeptide repeat protein [Gammaproteobacteria bacterium]MBU1653631.1 tetratricopeptide repeat protein [Gammaproteobacteria bacterium]MBU1960670.1 tetratricopeptide repeat protein [Gammaproteobacteria bacterium]
MARKPQRKSHAGPRPEAQRLHAIDKLLAMGRFDEALGHTGKAIRAFPRFGGFYRQRIDALTKLGQSTDAELTAYHWTLVRPESIQAWSALLPLSLSSGRAGIAYHAALHYNELAENTDHIPFPISPEFTQRIETCRVSPLTGDILDLETLRRMDLGLLCIQGRAFEEGIELLRGAGNEMPVRNNLGLCLFHLGRLDEALSCFNANWERDPRNLVALAWMIRLRLLSGREEAAAGLVPTLADAAPLRSEDVLAQITALLLMGREQEALRAFEKGLKQPWMEEEVPAQIGLMKHMGAVCHARTGKMGAANKLWHEALKANPGLDLARKNLTDLDLRVRDREGAWLLPLHEHIPYRWLEQVQAIAEGTVEKRLGALFAPVSVPFLQALHAIGDQATRKFCEIILDGRCQRGDKEAKQGLLAILKSPQGSYQDHFELASQMRDGGIYDSKEAFEIWDSQEGSQVRTKSLKIHNDADQTRMSGPQMALYEQALEAIRAKSFDEAKAILEPLSEQFPEEGSIWNNLALLAEAQGDDQNVSRLLHKAAAAERGNLIARCNMALFCIQSGDKEKARDLLNEVFDREELHIQEALSCFGTSAMLLASEGKFEEAEGQLDSAKPLAEEYGEQDKLDRYVRMVRHLRGGMVQRVLAGMMRKAKGK